MPVFTHSPCMAPGIFRFLATSSGTGISNFPMEPATRPYLASFGQCPASIIYPCPPGFAGVSGRADPLASDRLGKLNLSQAGLAARDAMVLDACDAGHAGGVMHGAVRPANLRHGIVPNRNSGKLSAAMLAQGNWNFLKVPLFSTKPHIPYPVALYFYVQM